MEITQKPISEESLRLIASFLPYFSENNEFGTMVTPKRDNEIVGFPYATYSDAVSELQYTLSDTNFLVMFNWTDWDEGKQILIQSNFDAISKCDLITLRMLVSTILRNERFSEGYFLRKTNDGTIQKILLRLQSIIDDGLIE